MNIFFLNEKHLNHLKTCRDPRSIHACEQKIQSSRDPLPLEESVGKGSWTYKNVE
jgi:hypothetical protein